MLLRHRSRSALRSSSAHANCNYRAEITGIEYRTLRPLRAWVMFRNAPWIFVAVAARNAPQGLLKSRLRGPSRRQNSHHRRHSLSNRCLSARSLTRSQRWQNKAGRPVPAFAVRLPASSPTPRQSSLPTHSGQKSQLSAHPAPASKPYY